MTLDLASETATDWPLGGQRIQCGSTGQGTEQDGTRLHVTQNNALYTTYKLFISGIFSWDIFDCGWPWVTEILAPETRNKGDTVWGWDANHEADTSEGRAEGESSRHSKEQLQRPWGGSERRQVQTVAGVLSVLFVTLNHCARLPDCAPGSSHGRKEKGRNGLYLGSFILQTLYPEGLNPPGLSFPICRMCVAILTW